jgi:hypothetical protein
MTISNTGHRPVYTCELTERGYTVLEDVLDPSEYFDPVLDSMARQVGSWASGQVLAGALARTYEALSLEGRLIELVSKGAGQVSQVLDISLPQGGVRHDTPMFLSEEVFSLLSAPSLLDAIEPFVDGEIWLSPVGHMRMKVPRVRYRSASTTLEASATQIS